MKMKRQKTRFIASSSLIASLYILLTYLSFLAGLSGEGLVQCRLSESLCVLPAFTPAAIPGLAAGCFLSNILTGGAAWDIVFGSLATLIGALITYWFRRFKFFSPIPPIAVNTAIIPFVLKYAYGIPNGLPVLAGFVFAGEAISCGIFGSLIAVTLEKTKSGRAIKELL